jgi:hypothetical protein
LLFVQASLDHDLGFPALMGWQVHTPPHRAFLRWGGVSQTFFVILWSSASCIAWDDRHSDISWDRVLWTFFAQAGLELWSSSYPPPV